MNCRPGDLAVVIAAFNRCNIGRIVRVQMPHDGTGDLVIDPALGPHWFVTCAVRMKWGVLGKTKIYRRMQGPAPDASLRPIRGDGSPRTLKHVGNASKKATKSIKRISPSHEKEAI